MSISCVVDTGDDRHKLLLLCHLSSNPRSLDPLGYKRGRIRLREYIDAILAQMHFH